MGIRKDRYKAMVPQVVGPLRLKGRVHQVEARLARRTHEEEAEDHAARPDDDRRHRCRPPLRRPRENGDGLRRAAEPGGARARSRRRRRDPVRRAGLQRLHRRRRRPGASQALDRAAQGPDAARRSCTSATATASRPTSTGRRRSGGEWRQYEEIFPAIAKSTIKQVSLECMHSHVPLRSDEAARRQGPAGRRHRRRLATWSRRRSRWPTRSARRCSSSPKDAAVSVHQLRHGADETRDRACKLAALGEGAALARQRYGA